MDARRRIAEADEGEGDGRDDFPFGLGSHPVGEVARERAMGADARGEPGSAEAANDHPELERAKASAELDTIVHEVDDRLALGRDEVLVHQREGTREDVRLGREERGAIERREQPLMRIDDE